MMYLHQMMAIAQRFRGAPGLAVGQVSGRCSLPQRSRYATQQSAYHSALHDIET